MSSLLKVSLAGCAALGALALATPATAAYTPRLVASGSGDETNIRVAFPDADDATARVTLYVPAPYTLGTPAVGAQIGTARATLIAKELGNTKVALSGTVTASDPTTPSNRQLGLGCTGQATHEQVWILTLSVGGSGQNPITLPAFVNRTTPAEAALGSIKIQFCFRSPDIPPAQGGQPLGGKPTDAQMTVRGVLLTPASTGDYLWRGIFTPYRPGTGTANPAGTVESQSIVRVPKRVTLRAKMIVRRRTVRGKLRVLRSVRLTGRVTESDAPLGGVPVRILRGGKRITTVRTNEAGAFVFTVRVTRTVSFRARALAPQRSTSCQGTPVVPTCVGATVSAFNTRSGAVTARVPKRNR